jgi:putative ABC transport system permease protein
MSLRLNVVQGLRSLFRKSAIESEMDEELSAFVEESTADKLRRGMTPDEAGRAARVEMGSTNAVKHHIRAGAWESKAEILWRDLWYGARTLARSPSFTIVAVLTLALGIGANTAIFQLLDAVRLRNLPVVNPSELTVIRLADLPGKRGSQESNYPALNNPLWEYIRDHQNVFSQVLAWSPTGFGIREGDHERVVRGLWVSGDFFNALGVRPALGRVFTSSDDRPGCGAAGVVVSYAFWLTQLGADPQVVGRTLMMGQHAVPILGVTSPGFTGPEVGSSFEVAAPICSQSVYWTEGNWLDSSTDWWLTVMGRLKPGESLSTANAGLATFSVAAFQGSIRKDYPTENVRDYLHFRLLADSAPGGVSWLRNEYESPLWMLLGLAGFVLLIACANLANLMLARGSARVREFAVRLSLGATRARLIWQLLWESLLVVLLGLISGLLLARVLSKALIALLSTQGDSPFLDLHSDWRVLGFTATLATITVLLFGLLPAFRTTRLAPNEGLKGGSQRSGSTQESNRLRRGLVITQVALSLVLVTGAVLFARTLTNLLTVDAGFRQDNILIAQLDLTPLRLPVARRPGFKGEMVSRIRSVAGVDSAAQADIVPLTGSSRDNRVWADGENRQSGFDPNFNQIGGGYFKTFGTPLVAGRDFDEQDTPGSPHVAIVNEEFARQFGKGGNPVGLRIRREATPHEPETAFEIVGVVKNSKYKDLREKVRPIVYLPIDQDPNPDTFEQLIVHSGLPLAGLTSSLKRTVAGVDPNISVDFQVFKTQIQESLLPERLMAALSGFFGLLAAMLTAVGLYGVISFYVARRTREIGIRMALGAGKRRVLSSILRETLMLTLLGVGAGLPLTFFVSHLIASKLFGVKPYDPVALAFAVLALCGVSMAAAYIPARRAAAVDPMVALRDE